MNNHLPFESWIERAFRLFHAENPVVYRLFDKFTRQAITSGRERFGARMVFERVRWYTAIETTDPDFKINNNFAPYYARLWMTKNPAYQGFFATRVLRAL